VVHVPLPSLKWNHHDELMLLEPLRERTSK